MHPINLLISTHLSLILLFDYLGTHIRLIVAGVLAVGYVVLAFALLATNRKERVLLVFPSLIVGSWLVSAFLISDSPNRHLVSFDEGLRAIEPFLMGVALIAFREKLALIPLIIGSSAIAGVAAIIAVLEPAVLLGTYRLHPFISGLHTSAYIISVLTILFVELRRRRRLPRIIAYPLIATSIFLVWGYGVRTAMLVLIVYFSVDVMVWLVTAKRIKLGTAGSIVIIILSVALMFGTFHLSAVGTEELNSFSSGRIYSYLERLDLLANRTFSGLLLGHGPGSDLVTTTVWWWEAKDAHSDLLHILWEGGIVSLWAVFAYFFAIIRLSVRATLAPISALLASSVVSNAILVRPNVAVLFFCVLALKMVLEDRPRTDPTVRFIGRGQMQATWSHRDAPASK